ncbi:MAG: hypothetical protein K2X77_26285, partial [Candidatus Obscuribacterales bacterium]|nr:hypothetical protein [Candidatus Obscuribacterales bacterium]
GTLAASSIQEQSFGECILSKDIGNRNVHNLHPVEGSIYTAEFSHFSALTQLRGFKNWLSEGGEKEAAARRILKSAAALSMVRKSNVPFATSTQN